MPWLDLEADIQAEFDEIKLRDDYEIQSFFESKLAAQSVKAREAKRKRYAWCKLHGRCIDCGERSASEKYPRCEFHLRKTLEHIKESKARALADGRCLRCGQRRGAGREENSYCEPCNKIRNNRLRERRSCKKRTENGPCQTCGGPVARRCRSVRITCSKKCFQMLCMAELIQSGVCVECKKNKAKEGVQLCSDCSKPRQAKVIEPATPETQRCKFDGCCNHFVVGGPNRISREYCSDYCRFRLWSGRKRERANSPDIGPGDRVRVSVSVTPERIAMVGKSGRVVSVGDSYVVQFYGKRKVGFFLYELEKHLDSACSI